MDTEETKLAESGVIRVTSADDLTLDQRYALTLRFADLVMGAMGYERIEDEEEQAGEKQGSHSRLKN